jgi:hypothetical protein
MRLNLSLSRLLPGLALALGLSFLTIGSCIYDPPLLGWNVWIRPTNFCSGETLFLNFVQQEGLQSVQLRASDGTQLVTIPQGSTCGVTPPMRREWLPLSVHVKTKAGEFDRSLADALKCIDEETWVSCKSAHELRDGSRTLRLVGEVTELDEATQTRVTVNLYEIWENFEGFAWDLSFSDFGARARVVRLRNDGTRRMRFDAPGWGGFVFQLDPGQESAAIFPPRWPSTHIEARYDTPEPRLTGYQKGEITKPENEHFWILSAYEVQISNLALLVVCMGSDS